MKIFNINLDSIIASLISLIGVVAIALALIKPHVYMHEYHWFGGENFNQDYGECRSQALVKGFGSTIDEPTLNALMRARGWNMKCSECNKVRWEE